MKILVNESNRPAVFERELYTPIFRKRGDWRMLLLLKMYDSKDYFGLCSLTYDSIVYTPNIYLFWNNLPVGTILKTALHNFEIAFYLQCKFSIFPCFSVLGFAKFVLRCCRMCQQFQRWFLAADSVLTGSPSFMSIHDSSILFCIWI